MDDIRGLKPLLSLEAPTGWLAAAVVLAALLAWALSRWLKSRPAPQAAPLPEAAGEEGGWTAQDWLDDLATRGWVEQGRDREFHVQLAAILRTQLHVAWGVPAAHLTTPEAVQAFARCAEQPAASALAALLQACDAVKFAEVRAGTDAMRARLQAARSLLGQGPLPVLGPRLDDRAVHESAQPRGVPA